MHNSLYVYSETREGNILLQQLMCLLSTVQSLLLDDTLSKRRLGFTFFFPVIISLHSPSHSSSLCVLAGVGDLYTDPQMHTVDQKEYGEANLGTRGMALFFSSHVCGPLCEAIGE